MGDLARRSSTTAAALAAALLAQGAAAGAAHAMPAWDTNPAATAASKKKKAKPFKTRKIRVHGAFALGPGTIPGPVTHRPDGVSQMRGTVVVGRVSGRIVKGRKGLPSGVKNLLKLDFRGKLDVDRHFAPQWGNPVVARGLVAGRSSRKRKITGCIRFTTTSKAGKPPVQKVKFLGASGPAARFVVSGKPPLMTLDRQPAGTRRPPISLTVKQSRKRPLSAGCKKLLRGMRKR